MAMLANSQASNNEKLSGKNDIWLIDIGASKHMTGQRHLLSDITTIDPCYIGLPDGSKIIANSKECTKFGSNIFLIRSCLSQI